jgi:RNA polymerase-interacting CarD/CdnL/TRCF family regulator
MTQHIAFQVGDVVFYVGNGVGEITAIVEENIAGAPCTLFVITSKRKPGVLKVPLGNPKLLSAKTFVGKDPLTQVRDVLSQSPGAGRPSKGKWAPKFQAIERRLAEVSTLYDVLTIVRDMSRPINDVHPLSSIDVQRSLKWWLVDSLSPVLKRPEDNVLKTLNKILKENGKLAFPD